METPSLGHDVMSTYDVTPLRPRVTSSHSAAAPGRYVLEACQRTNTDTLPLPRDLTECCLGFFLTVPLVQNLVITSEHEQILDFIGGWIL